MNVAQLCWMLWRPFSGGEGLARPRRYLVSPRDCGVFSHRFRLDISQSRLLISDGQSIFITKNNHSPWCIIWHLILCPIFASFGSRDTTKERTVNTFCPVNFPPLDYHVARANIESSAGKVQQSDGKNDVSPSLKLTVCTWKWIVGRWISFWDGLFSGDMLVSGNVFFWSLWLFCGLECVGKKWWNT